MSPTLAQQLLQEELMNTCLVCSNILTSYTTLCMVCSQSNHLGCVDISKETCYACLGSQHQIDQHNNITEETALPIVRRETTATINEIPQTELNMKRTYHSKYQLLIKNKNHIFQIMRTQRQQERQIQLKLKI